MILHDKNLAGKSFKDQDCSRVDFSYADLRGTDFTNAILTGANFSYSRGGADLNWQKKLDFCFSIFTFMSSIVVALPGILIAIFLDNKSLLFHIFYCVIILAFFALTTILNSFKKANIVVFFLLFLSFLATLIVYLGSQMNIVDISFELFVYVFVGGLFFSISMIVAVLAIGTILVWNRSARLDSNLVLFSLILLAACLVGFTNKDQVSLWILSEIIILVVAMTGLYIGKQALQGNSEYVFIQNGITRVRSVKSTCFKNAVLTNANFIQARLKDTDLRTAHLAHANWLHVEYLEQAKIDNTYLANLLIRELLTRRQGKEGKFDHQNLQGLNLEQANLVKASLIETNLSNSNLKGADLSQATLVKTRLDNANLSGAILTGARIENWRIFRNVNLELTTCKYIYLGQPNSDNSNSERFPRQREFKKNEFSVFVDKLLNTIDLYHDHQINPQVAIDVLYSLSGDYQRDIEIVGLEQQGNGVALKLDIPKFFRHSEFKQQYQSQYKTTLNLFLSNPEKLLPSIDFLAAEISRLAAPLKRLEQLNGGEHHLFDYVDNLGLFIISNKGVGN